MTVWINAAVALLVAALVSPPLLPEEESLDAARALYASASYEESLQLLDKLHAGPLLPDEARRVALYRAFCLLALGRGAEAEQAIEKVVTLAPLYHPDEEMSPRVLSTFRDVRRRMLPIVVQSRYADAKAAFDAKQFEQAARRFDEVLAVLDDLAAPGSAGAGAFADLRMLAVGFRDLSLTSAGPPPTPVPAQPLTALPTAPAAPTAALSVAPSIYAADDPGVIAPTAVHQALPQMPQVLPSVRPGVLELVIDERGLVTEATMLISIAPKYDGLIVEAARKWKYEPATRNGAAVRYRKLVQIAVQPSSNK